MKIHKTKHANLTTAELLALAQSAALCADVFISKDLFLELIYRLEETHNELLDAAPSEA